MEPEENDLDLALRLAANDPAQRPLFVRTLLAGKILALGQVIGGQGSGQVLPAGSQLQLVHWEVEGKAVIPCFTSLSALQHAITEHSEYIMLSAKSLFEMTRGNTLLLCGMPGYGKYFTPEEVDHLLTSGTNVPVARRIISNGTKVMLSPLENPPSPLIDGLNRLFETIPQVRTAHLVNMRNGDEVSLLLALEVDGDFDRISRDAGLTASAFLSDARPMDVIQISKGGGEFAEYFFESNPPFYDRNLSRSPFGHGGRA